MDICRVYRAWPTQADVLYGLAVCSFKLGQYGDAALFAELGLVHSSSRDKFYYLLAATRRLLNQIPEATDNYAKLLECCKIELNFEPQTHINEIPLVEESVLFPAIRLSNVAFFNRFSDLRLKELMKSGSLKECPKGSLLILNENEACVLLTGQVGIRSHARGAVQPEVLWHLSNRYPAAGDYIGHSQHSEVIDSSEIWSRFETDSVVLEVKEKVLSNLLRLERVTQKDILVKTIQTFPHFSSLNISTIEMMVYDLMEIKTYRSGDVIQAELVSIPHTSIGGKSSSRSVTPVIDKESLPFQVIISGLCTLRVESIHYDSSLLGRGDFFCEESLMKDKKGFASAGSIIAKSKFVEVARISPELFYKLPKYEIEKMQTLSTSKGQVEFAAHQIEKQRTRQRHVRRSTAI